ncbi:ABC transporter permease [Halomicrobium salinisoli]|uniref:ABC transporter permease n=1 Tax=Halomicrobium salinisoli TaxID=2878391 RepID=UPI001CEFDBAB|nr:ABC transporter permease [Halomicrobium salinisoli]
MIDGRLARRFPLVALAWHNLSRAKARSLLATAGITIGVIAIASLGMFGSAYEESLRNNFDDTASSVYVSPGEDADFERMDRDHVSEIERYADAPVHPIGQYGAEVSGLSGSDQATIYALSEPGEFVDVRDGRLPNDWRSRALVGPTLADRLGVQPGDSITIDGSTTRVVGVLEESGQSSLLSTDEAVLLPPSQVEAREYGWVVVRTEDPQAAFQAAERLESNLNGREERYEVNDFESAIDRFNRQIDSFNRLLIGIGSVSLLVASVSILNVMLMSTIERREEIGVMRAVGYHRLDVLRLMLAEAALLGLVGAVVGVILSVLMGMAINDALLSDPLAFTADALTYTVLGFLFGTLASFVSGFYPAWKAANSRPVEALRD